MQTLEEMQAERAAKRAADAAARRAKHAAEFAEQVVPLLDANDELHVHPEKGSLASDVCGFVVFRPMNAAEYARWKSTQFASADKRGATEAKAKASELVARGCLVYPPLEVYALLCEKSPAVADEVAAAILKIASAREEEEGKG